MLQKKSFIIFFIILILLFTFIPVSKAGIAYTVTSVDVNSADTIAGVRDYLIFSDTNSIYLIVCPEGTERVYVDGNYLRSSSSFLLYVKASDGVWNYVNTRTYYDLAQYFTYYYSTVNIMQGVSGDTVFFYQMLTLSTSVNTVQQVPVTMVKVVKMILPVSLLILGICLIVLLVRLVISRMR